MKPKLGATFSLLKETFQEWRDDKASRLAAALTYYTIFSLAPLLLIVISLVGLLVEPEDIRGNIRTQIEDLTGAEGADMVLTMVENANRSDVTGFAAAVGVVTLVLGALGVFNALRDSLNTIWDAAPPAKGGIVGTLKARFSAFALIPTVGFLLLVSLIADAVLAAGRSHLAEFFPDAIWTWVIQLVGLVVSFGIITLLFAAIYRILPDVDIAWSDVWVGAAVTALLFTIGRFAIGLYLGQSSASSAYGAAGSLIVILLWIYYSAQILFFGAEFTQVYARRYGTHFGRVRDASATTQAARLARPGQPARPGDAAVRPAPVQVVRPRADVVERPSPKGYALSGLIAFMLGVFLMGWRK